MGSVTSYETARGKRYRVRYRTPDRHQTDKRGFRTKREAEDFLASVEVSKMRGEWVDPTRSKVNVGEWAEAWYSAQLQIKPTTRAGYRLYLDKHVLPKWGTVPLRSVQHADVQRWVSSLAATLAPSTVRQIHLVLAGTLNYAVRDGRLVKSPSDDIRLPRIVRTPRGYLTHDQVARLARDCGEFGDVVRFLAYTGLRWGEMAALKVGRVDLSRRRIEVAEAVSEVGGAAVWGTPKGHGRRSVPFPALLATELAQRCQGKRQKDLVFTSASGAWLRNGNFRHRHFDPALTLIREGRSTPDDPTLNVEADPNFPVVTPHDLRHTAAWLAVSAGASVKSVQRMLGHASAAMTLDVYADLFDDDLDAVACALDDQANASGRG
ncbi:site-specific integrase [Cryobacterium glucosi]|uniref:Site-specific integrase n=1 Tax=Cryobacterium glucosi TaxID=1259175 RepID=A0ABY2IMS2_9MICO|nr:site-specific integrase [Cryobacterium glucosi]TFC19495.1 site-specific integrase [Cryobacterium glucosi]